MANMYVISEGYTTMVRTRQETYPVQIGNSANSELVRVCVTIDAKNHIFRTIFE